MKNYITLIAIILSFGACIPPGKLNESLDLSNKMAKSQEKLKSDLADAVSSFRQKESTFKQRIKQLEDSISLVLKACAETKMQPDLNASFSNKPQHIIYFDFDSYNLIDSSFINLSIVVDFLKRNDDYNCVLQGYTDLEGPQDYNLKLSENRVISARNYLLSYGISANRITGSFFGKAFINIETKDREENSRNRRVEIFLVKK